METNSSMARLMIFERKTKKRLLRGCCNRTFPDRPQSRASYRDRNFEPFSSELVHPLMRDMTSGCHEGHRGCTSSLGVGCARACARPPRPRSGPCDPRAPSSVTRRGPHGLVARLPQRGTLLASVPPHVRGHRAPASGGVCPADEGDPRLGSAVRHLCAVT